MKYLILLGITLCLINLARSTGEPRGMNLGEAKSHEALKFAIDQLDRETNSLYHRKLFKVEKAEKQLVSGMIYKFTFVWGDTECKKNGEEEVPTPMALESCNFYNDGAFERCLVSIYTIPWQNSTTLEKKDCTAVPRVHLPNLDHPMSLMEAEALLKIPSIGVKATIGRRHFSAFKLFFNKTYSSEENEQERYGIFLGNMKYVQKLQENERGSAIYGATVFADMTHEEFRKNFAGPIWPIDANAHLETYEDLSYDDVMAAPDSWDWRQHGAVTAVKNQGMCGSCWAFSTTGNVEGQWAINKKKLVSLSEQELVDCDHNGDEGCSGGLPSNAYGAIVKLGGLEPESDYPYAGYGNTKCEFNKSEVAVGIAGGKALPKDEAQLAAWLHKNGPISIGLNANAMMWYWGGISHPWHYFCSPNSIDHGVLLVGYGSVEGTPYWIVKNSWGSYWGEKGYYRVYRGDGTCGLNTMATSAYL